MSAGLSNPKRSAAICIVAIVVGAGLLLWGIAGLDAQGNGPGPSGAAVAIGLLMCIVFPLLLLNFLWAVRLTGAMRRGENVIARWTVPLQTLEEFRRDDSDPGKLRRKNDYRLPRKLPPEGIEVIFSPAAVMIGDAFFGLAKSGVARFTDISIVPGNPLSIAFRMAVTTARVTSYGSAHLNTSRSELRVPVARTARAEASKVLAHYTSVQAGKTIARPGFWSFRIKLGLWAAGIGATVGAAGFLLNAMKVQGEIPLIMAVSGVMVALGGLVLAGLAALLQRGEKEDRGRG